MLYLHDEVIKNLQPSWKKAIELIQEALHTWAKGNFSQPVKPYLRFGNPKNRIIAMPAFLGDSFNVAGIKWIASFPSNFEKGLPRAHSITLLNDADTGKPIAMINTSRISGIRTAAVSGLLLLDFIKAFPKKQFKIGIVGFGPIGQLHLEMLREILGERINCVHIFDKMGGIKEKATFPYSLARSVNSWQEAYQDADIFITCTTSSEPYIDLLPKKGSLHLNVSLRDYCPEILMKCKHLIVDDWEEVCRENTDIELAHKKYGLQKYGTYSLSSVIEKGYFSTLDPEKFTQQEFCIFNPMGMALFDIAIAHYYYHHALDTNQGLILKD